MCRGPFWLYLRWFMVTLSWTCAVVYYVIHGRQCRVIRWCPGCSWKETVCFNLLASLWWQVVDHTFSVTDLTSVMCPAQRPSAPAPQLMSSCGMRGCIFLWLCALYCALWWSIVTFGTWAERDERISVHTSGGVGRASLSPLCSQAFVIQDGLLKFPIC